MRVRIKIVPISAPDAPGRWISWKIPKYSLTSRSVFGKARAPKGFFIVRYRRSFRRKHRRQK